jgi:hypothetical protein
MTKFVGRKKSTVFYSRVMVIDASHIQHDGLAVFGFIDTYVYKYSFKKFFTNMNN